MIASIQLVCGMAVLIGVWQVLSGWDENGRKSESVGEWFTNAARATLFLIIPAIAVWWVLGCLFGFSTPE